MTKREEFIAVYQENIQRRGADRLLEWLDSDASDFFTAPSSTRFHGAYEGGLVEHSLNVYECLKDYLNRPRTKELYGMDYTPETIAVTALLHDICKVGFMPWTIATPRMNRACGKRCLLYRAGHPALWARGKIRVHDSKLYAADP